MAIVGFIIAFIVVCFLGKAIFKAIYENRVENLSGRFVRNYIIKTVVIASFLGTVTCTAIMDPPEKTNVETSDR